LQVLVDGPSSKAELAVPRHASPLSAVSLTNIVIPKLPRAAGSAALKKQWEAAGVDEKWTGSSYAKKMEKATRRKQLNDFERFKVMRLRKQVRFDWRKDWGGRTTEDMSGLWGFLEAQTTLFTTLCCAHLQAPQNSRHHESIANTPR
jgi:ribosomal protein L14E/L6E/L27E